MPTHVRFRINKITGEVEEFLVDDQDRTLPEAEHDRIATAVAQTITRNPMIHEVSAVSVSDNQVQFPEDFSNFDEDREQADENQLREEDS
ncbi:MAG: hypothetical protein OMM_08785 [Candidatus Magnetoglobus multicellularis str. Araruama]|jgi:hypothetical protein|uniref:FtsH ternary system domain-containing protein n=1 Tax=Candidatus Magnetoglobus multicellularis str. Araruama TaxID=890399 RepID=A0A1V1P6H8_9BACT|nr:MAG: hypothetical protein OMM_08785 [Candidatus Magnetoglobus multicellularis str. Araruama]